LFSWEPFEFGYRHAQVLAARTTEMRTQEQVTLTRFGVASAVAEASLALLADEQRVSAMQADVNRREIFDKSVHALVDAHLRPGADASRADAELAAARTRLIQAQGQIDLGSIALAQVLGLAGPRVAIVPGPLLQAPPDEPPAQSPVEKHPAALVEQGRVSEENAR